MDVERILEARKAITMGFSVLRIHGANPRQPAYRPKLSRARSSVQTNDENHARLIRE
jgi:hypothetical protein